MGKIVAIANQKGGVGKTTTAVNLCASLAAAEKKTLLVDVDPQGNAGSGVGIDKHKLETTIYEVLLDETLVDGAITKTLLEHLYLLPADGRLTGADKEAFGAVRVMMNCNQTGEAAGVACAIALDNGLDVADISTDALRAKLREGGSVIP